MEKPSSYEEVSEVTSPISISKRVSPIVKDSTVGSLESGELVNKAKSIIDAGNTLETDAKNVINADNMEKNIIDSPFGFTVPQQASKSSIASNKKRQSALTRFIEEPSSNSDNVEYLNKQLVVPQTIKVPEQETITVTKEATVTVTKSPMRTLNKNVT